MSGAEPLGEALAAAERDIAAGRLGAARAQTEHLLAGAPGDARVMVLAAKVAYLERDLTRAEKLLDQAAALERRIPELYHLIGNVNHDLGKPDRAVSAYRRAIRLRPEFAEAHNDLGTAYFAKGWLREAEECFREAARLKPGEPEAHQNLGETLRRQGRATEARRSLQRALRLRVGRAIRRVLGLGRA